MEKFKKCLRKFLKEMRNYKYTVIVSIAFLFVIILLLGAYRILMPSNNTAKYGNRLEGIEEVEVDKSQMKKLLKALNDDEQISEASARIDGKIVKVFITVNDGVEPDAAKGKTNTVLANFTEEQIKYYDFEVFIKCSVEKEGYPIIGYKNRSNPSFLF